SSPISPPPSTSVIKLSFTLQRIGSANLPATPWTQVKQTSPLACPSPLKTPHRPQGKWQRPGGSPARNCIPYSLLPSYIAVRLVPNESSMRTTLPAATTSRTFSANFQSTLLGNFA